MRAKAKARRPDGADGRSRRTGAGRPRIRPNPDLIGPGVPHLRRDDVEPGERVQVRMLLRKSALSRGLPMVRKVVTGAVSAAGDRGGMRVLEATVRGSRIYLVVQAEGAGALSSGMNGLATRIARRLNGAIGGRGSVFADRYAAETR